MYIFLLPDLISNSFYEFSIFIFIICRTERESVRTDKQQLPDSEPSSTTGTMNWLFYYKTFHKYQNLRQVLIPFINYVVVFNQKRTDCLYIDMPVCKELRAPRWYLTTITFGNLLFFEMSLHPDEINNNWMVSLNSHNFPNQFIYRLSWSAT